MSGLRLLLCSDRGIYIPRDFVTEFDLSKWQNIDSESVDILEDVSHEAYWEVWDDILRWATHQDEKGRVWSLYQDGDLWACCPDLMYDEEYFNFFGEERSYE